MQVLLKRIHALKQIQDHPAGECVYFEAAANPLQAPEPGRIRGKFLRVEGPALYALAQEFDVIDRHGFASRKSWKSFAIRSMPAFGLSIRTTA